MTSDDPPTNRPQTPLETTGGDSPGNSGADSNRPPQPQADTRPVDPNLPDEKLVQETKIQIRTLVNEIQQLAQSDCSVEEFYDGFLSRVTSALASLGGAIWRVNDSGRLELQYQVNIAATELAGNEAAQISHDLLLQKVIQSNEPALVQPNSGGTGEGEAGNPTSSLLVIERLKVDQQTVGLVEVFQRAGSGPTTQRGYLRFLVQMCEIASDFLKNKKIRTFQRQQQLWEKLEQFIRASHLGLDPKQTAYTIVNEGRRLVDCDRVSFAKKHGNKYWIEVVSGLDSIDRRADEIKKLGELATAVIRGEKDLWYNGDTDSFPPQIEDRIQEYVDRSHSKVVCVIPLRETHSDDIVENPEAEQKKIKKEVLGALIFERLGDARIDGQFRKRVEVVKAHASDALSNAMTHNRVFLMPLWQMIGRSKIFSRAAVPRWVIFLSILLVIVGVLGFLPWDFELSGDGKLTPKFRRQIFAPYDGEVKLLLKPDEKGQIHVTKDQRLVQIQSLDLEDAKTRLEGQLREEQSKVISAESRLSDPDLPFAESIRLKQEATTSRARYEGLYKELKLVERKIEKLLVLSPANGKIIDWQLTDKLDGRQVSRTENLMTLVDEKGDWIIELEMLEKKFGHLSRAYKSLKDLKVTFVLASLPNESFEGKIESIDRKADIRSEQGNVILIRIAIDKNDIPEELRLYGTKVTARIHCGKRSLGYVLFREVYETMQRNIFFWF